MTSSERESPTEDTEQEKDAEHENSNKNNTIPDRWGSMKHVTEVAVNSCHQEQPTTSINTSQRSNPASSTYTKYSPTTHSNGYCSVTKDIPSRTREMAIGSLEASISLSQRSVEAHRQPGHVSSSIWEATSRNKIVLVCLIISNIVNFMPQSILAPFFPKEANLKHVSDTTVGWIFGVFALVQVVTCPLFGRLMPITGPKFLFVCGSLVAGISSCLFGLLEHISATDGSELFVIFCFLTRSFLGAGCAAISVSILALGALTFPDNPSTVLGLIETACGIGLMLGPAFGGFLYEAGGFQLPFIAMGGTILVSIPLYICILPNTPRYSQERSHGVLFKILKIPSVWIISLEVFVGSISWIILEPTLEPHLRQFNLSGTEVGLVFFMLSGTYAIASPFLGWISDKMNDTNPVMIIGFLFSAANLLLLGPSPLFGSFQNYSKLWLNLVIIGLMGIGFSLTIVPSLDKIIHSVEKNGIVCDLSTTGAISGLWFCVYSMGEFIGPVLAGTFVDLYGFSWCMSYFAGLCAFMTLPLCGLWIYEHSRCYRPIPNESERTPLLKSPVTSRA